MTDCDHCGKPITRYHWWRGLPDVLLCECCFYAFASSFDRYLLNIPGDDLHSTVIRIQLARTIKTLRSHGERAGAKKFLNSLRGTGIPSNILRKGKVN